MACPGVGPCQVWSLDLACCPSVSGVADPCLTDGTPVAQEIVDSAVLAASQFVWAVTGRQFGTCEVTIRPCRSCRDECCLPEGGFTGSGFPWYPVHQSDGSWINISCGCQDQCSCVSLCEIELPYPVCSVEEVLIDGEIVDPETYRVDDFNKLVRLGSDCWPTCNDLTLPTTEEGTWSVTVVYGRPVPELALRAASEFACELIKSCVGRPCQLPRNVTAVTRQGITEVFADPNQFLQGGYTGLGLVDLAIRAYNPHKLMSKSKVYSPDVANKWRKPTWQGGE